MKIALVVPTFPQLSETFIANKAVGLLDRGHDVHVVCGRSGPEQWRSYGPDHRVNEMRDRVHLTAPTSVGRDVPSRLARAAGDVIGNRDVAAHHVRAGSDPLTRRLRDLYLDATLIGLRPDVVHFEFGSLARGRTTLKEKLGCALTVSFRGHDINFVGLEEPGHLDPVWEHADRVHLLGHGLWQRALLRGAPPDLPRSLIPPALDAAVIDVPERDDGVLGSTERPLRVVSVGRLHWTKGYEYALEAIADLRQRGFHVQHRIVGAGPLREAVGFWRHQLDLDEHVAIVGAVTPGRVAEHYRWADVMLHTATSEGFCNAVLEAQAHGLPVVTSDADGLSENVVDGVTGTVVPRREVAPVAEALARYATEPSERLAAGAAGAARARRQFGWADHLDAWEEFYVEAIEARARLGPGSEARTR